ncbi:MAG: helix-turn-helix transcriptional regulator [Cyanobacteria bacterium J06638_22]
MPNYEQDINLVDLADLVGLSSFYFVRLFKQSMGSSPPAILILGNLPFALSEQTSTSSA